MASHFSSNPLDMSSFASTSFADVSFPDPSLVYTQEEIEELAALLEATNSPMHPETIQRAVEANPDLRCFPSEPAPPRPYDPSVFSPTEECYPFRRPTFEEIFPPQPVRTSLDFDFTIDLEALGLTEIPTELPELTPDLQAQLDELVALMDEYDRKWPLTGTATYSPAPSPPSSDSDASSDPGSPASPASSWA
ncbi:hypothetical protein OF83DRAFT_590631 [Amylostereum chailletii]|nr:hypothetical protein OF83DRAFT_590631 [Amylostereum chailletii]